MSDANSGNLSLLALLVGLLLIIIPEPATTATGLAVTTASVGVRVTNGAGEPPGGA